MWKLGIIEPKDLIKIQLKKKGKKKITQEKT